MLRLESERLILRHWTVEDAEDCYKFAKDERIGPNAGWNPHKSVEESKDIIQNILSSPETYAICLKEDLKAIGSIGLFIGKKSAISGLSDDEGEVGYWLGVDFWGKGITTEAVLRLTKHAFNDLGLKRLWARYMFENHRSGSVLKKAGFEDRYDIDDTDFVRGGAIKVHILCLEKEKWESHNN